jgi:hypothetical protein
LSFLVQIILNLQSIKSVSVDLQFYPWKQEIVGNKAGSVGGVGCYSYFVLGHEPLERQDGVSRHSVVMNEPVYISSFLNGLSTFPIGTMAHLYDTLRVSSGKLIHNPHDCHSRNTISMLLTFCQTYSVFFECGDYGDFHYNEYLHNISCVSKAF